MEVSVKNRLIKRNIKCMLWIILRSYPVVILCIAIIAGMEILGGTGIKIVISEIPRIIPFFNIYILMVISVSVSIGYFPVMLSMGSGKYSFFVAKHITYIISAIILSVINIITYMAADRLKTSNCLIMAGSMFLCLLFGNVLGNVIWRYGNLGRIIYIIICGMIGATVSILHASDMLRGIFSVNKFYLGVLLLLISIAAYLPALIFDWKCIKKYEIR